MRMFDRRRFLQAVSALGTAAAVPARAQLNPRPRFTAFPFSLGVASGYPQPSGFALWTRLAPVPQAPGGGVPREVVPVTWEVATDEGMRELAASGIAYAAPEWAHSVHVEPLGLQPGRPYWYRFTAGDARSPVGRTHTAPAASASVSKLRLALASCAHYEQGFFGAYRQIAADHPDLVIHVGDYIYESSWGRDHVRKHGAPEPITLEDYRARYALYKSDADLQAAHLGSPWLLTWDDHEVENDYADDLSENLDRPEWFLARRAAAYRAWYEHMPVPRTMVPLGPNARIYTRVAYGSLANFYVLDDRQYRAHEVCPRPGRGGSNTLDVTECPALAEPKRTMLGAEQEQWLDAALASAGAQWNVLAQQTLMAQFDRKAGPGRSAWTDGWDGYPVARQRLLDSIRTKKVRNPVVLGGDVHSFNVADLKHDFDDPASQTVASEFVGTSITSQGAPMERVTPLLADNPHMKFVDSSRRGYLRLELAPGLCRAELRAMESVQKPDAACSTLKAFVVEDGKPGAQPA
jgi:alkaline phosphatase D